MFSNNSWAPQNVGPRAIARFAPPPLKPALDTPNSGNSRLYKSQSE